MAYSIMLSNKNWVEGFFSAGVGWGIGGEGASPCSQSGWALVYLCEMVSDWVSITFFFFSLPLSLLIKLSLSQPLSFLTFILPIPSLILLGTKSGKAAVWCLVAGQDQSITYGIRVFLILFTSKKAILTILVPPHPVHLSVFSASFLSSFQLYQQFYP